MSAQQLTSLLITSKSKTKSSLSLLLNPPSNPGKCAFNYQPKDDKRRERERNAGLIYKSASHPFTGSVEENTSSPNRRQE